MGLERKTKAIKHFEEEMTKGCCINTVVCDS